MKKQMKKTEAMLKREKATGNKFKIYPDGYGILEGNFYSKVIYISLPKGHPCIDVNYFEFSVNVNGGLTFGENNVFGWDYAHFRNTNDYEGDIKRALKFFREKEQLKSSDFIKKINNSKLEGYQFK